MDTTVLVIVIVIPVLIISMIVTIVFFQRYKHRQQNTENSSPSPLKISDANEHLTPPSYRHSPRSALPRALEASYMGDVSSTTLYHDYHSPSS